MLESSTPCGEDDSDTMTGQVLVVDGGMIIFG